MPRHTITAGIAAAALASAALASPVSANPAGAVACERADATFAGYPVQEVRFLLEVVDHGAPVTSARYTFTGPAGATTIPLELTDGAHALELYGTRLGVGFGRRVLLGSATLQCGPVPAPEPTPAPTPTPPPVYRGPGPVQTVTPGPQKVTTPRTRPRLKPRSRVRVWSCRIGPWRAKPRAGISPKRRPGLRTFRVARSKATGKWYGYNDRVKVVRYRNGKVRVTIRLGGFCGPVYPRVTG